MTVVRTRFSLVAMLLHWSIAAFVLTNLALGAAFHIALPTQKPFLYQTHKSIGVVLLVLSLARLAWRLLNEPPPFPGYLTAWEKALTVLVERLFYGLLILTPIAGWLLSDTAKMRFPITAFGLVKWPAFPGIAGLDAAGRLALHEAAEQAHHLMAYAIVGLLLLHIAGAVRHQISHDRAFIGRMVPSFRRTGA